MNDPYKVIKYVLRTEKGTRLEPEHKYVFCVDKKANKLDIKRAVEHIYRVDVTAVNTVIMSGKLRRVRYQAGHTPDWKKAVVTVKKGQKINIA